MRNNFILLIVVIKINKDADQTISYHSLFSFTLPTPFLLHCLYNSPGLFPSSFLTFLSTTCCFPATFPPSPYLEVMILLAQRGTVISWQENWKWENLICSPSTTSDLREVLGRLYLSYPHTLASACNALGSWKVLCLLPGWELNPSSVLGPFT